MKTTLRSLTLIACAFAFTAAPAPAQDVRPGSGATSSDVASLRTAPERTGYIETTRYDDVVSWMQRVTEASPVIQLDTFGYSMEGRALPLAIVARGLTASTPDAVRASGRTVVYLQGNIHAGEVEGKESLLMLLREFAQGQHAQLLDSLVLLVAPIYNADGNERLRLTNRPRQHGPIGGMGQRPNAQDYDLNRDHMKLDSPEARSLVQMMTRWDAHVLVDLHTTNGTRHAYHLTYSPPLHPNTAAPITTLLRERWLLDMTRTIREKHGWEYYYYGNAQPVTAYPGEGPPVESGARGWYTFDYRPRFNNNYIGLRNRIAILSEAYAYLTFEDRITATSRFVDEILAWSHANATLVRQTVDAAQAEPVIGQRLAVRAEFERSAEPVTILMGGVTEEINPYSGAVILRRTDERRPERMYEFGTFRGTTFEVAPSAYIVIEPTPAVLANLSAHGVRYDVAAAARTVNAETFRVDSTTVAEREFQGHRERVVNGEWQAASSVQVPAGAITIAMDQPLARLIFTLLEPQSDDGLVNWNYFDSFIEGGRGVPVVRVR